MLKLIRTTIVGGIVFLIPIAILLAVIAKGLQATGVIARPARSFLCSIAITTPCERRTPAP